MTFDLIQSNYKLTYQTYFKYIQLKEVMKKSISSGTLNNFFCLNLIKNVWQKSVLISIDDLVLYGILDIFPFR